MIRKGHLFALPDRSKIHECFRLVKAYRPAVSPRLQIDENSLIFMYPGCIQNRCTQMHTDFQAGFDPVGCLITKYPWAWLLKKSGHGGSIFRKALFTRVTHDLTVAHWESPPGRTASTTSCQVDEFRP